MKISLTRKTQAATQNEPRKKRFVIEASGGYAFYLIMCAAIVTIIGLWSTLAALARWLYPYIS